MTSPLAKMMSDNGITITVTHLHVVWFDDKGKRELNPMDKWYALIEYRGKSFGTFYSTGMGHRNLQKFPRTSRTGDNWIHKGDKYQSRGPGGDGAIYTLEEMVRKNYLQLPKEGPRTDYILQALLSDAQSGTESFLDYCSNYGIDEDSLKALKTYLACQETGTALRRLFGSELMSKLMEASEDL